MAAASGEVWTGILPAVLILALAAGDYVLWERRNRPWHDWTVILLLLPAILAAVWIAVGGLVKTNLSKSMKELPLSKEECAQIVAFMQALSSPAQSFVLPVLPR